MSLVARPSAARSLRRLVGPRAVGRSARERAASLAAAGAVAGAAFGAVAVASARRTTVAVDNRLHEEMVDGMDGAAADAVAAVAPAIDSAAEWWVYGPAALATAAAVLGAPGRTRHTRRSRRAGAVAIAAVPALAAVLSPAFDRWLPQPPTGPRRRPVDHPVFPSGHAFRASAVALAAGYVATREGVVRAAHAWPLAVAAPAAVGFSRLVREKHLASDVLGGWLVGIALAATTAAVYELARAPRRPRSWWRGG